MLSFPLESALPVFSQEPAAEGQAAHRCGGLRVPGGASATVLPGGRQPGRTVASLTASHAPRYANL